MFWTPTILICQIYEKNLPIDLPTCTTAEILSLVNAIQEIWTDPVPSNVWYKVEARERSRWFRPSRLQIEVSCLQLSSRSFTGKRQCSISSVKHGRPLGNRVQLHPRPTLAHTWRAPVEVVFSVV